MDTLLGYLQSYGVGILILLCLISYWIITQHWIRLEMEDYFRSIQKLIPPDIARDAQVQTGLKRYEIEKTSKAYRFSLALSKARKKKLKC